MRSFIWIPILLLAGLAVFGFFMFRQHPVVSPVSSIGEDDTPRVRAAQAYMLPLADTTYAPVRTTTVPDPVLDANAALLYHVESDRILYEKNPDIRVPIASLTKLLSALVVRDVFMDDEIVVVSSASVRVDQQKQTLYLGERLPVRDLIAMMLVESSNDAAYALANYASAQSIDFVQRMNEKASVLGMVNCHFTDPAGLDDMAYCTASDLLRLVRAALRNAPTLWPLMASPRLTIHSTDGAIVHQVESTDELLGQVPGIVGGKTGNTDGALGCMLLVVNIGQKGDTLIAVVLGSRARFTDTRTLVQWAQDAYRWH